mmetsp:Transcript_6598/g.18486  ORF Transcript_6598/g.18486 Transcript_6598/m.18486 type:complete len:178 (+) Transcript_6598:1224-1757(+)
MTMNTPHDKNRTQSKGAATIHKYKQLFFERATSRSDSLVDRCRESKDGDRHDDFVGFHVLFLYSNHCVFSKTSSTVSLGSICLCTVHHRHDLRALSDSSAAGVADASMGRFPIFGPRKAIARKRSLTRGATLGRGGCQISLGVVWLALVANRFVTGGFPEFFSRKMIRRELSSTARA